MTFPAASKTSRATDSINVDPFHGSSALSWPMRELWPPASTNPALPLRPRLDMKRLRLDMKRLRLDMR